METAANNYAHTRHSLKGLHNSACAEWKTTEAGARQIKCKICITARSRRRLCDDVCRLYFRTSNEAKLEGIREIAVNLVLPLALSRAQHIVPYSYAVLILISSVAAAAAEFSSEFDCD